MLTPEDFKNKTFSKGFRGYEVEEVDKFLKTLLKEYEYLYLDKEITIDKIMAKTRRKRVLTIDVNKIEILAPEKSYQLDSYRNRQVKAIDYSAGHDLPDQKLYVMFYEGSQKYLLNLTEDFAKTIKGIIPRKVFTD